MKSLQGKLHGQYSLSAKRREIQANVLFRGREEKLATDCVYLVQRTMYGAAVVGAATVGSVVLDASKVSTTSGVLQRYTCCMVQY